MNGTKITPATILLQMAVPGMAKAYVLGSFERRVTVYSQQVRALNLVYALTETGLLSAGKRLAVIGGGVAGLTLAAAAASQKCTVRVLEQKSRILHLFAGCKNRWLHPHIYDWPATGSLELDAGLPLMNWHADTADKVEQQLRRAWEALPGRSHVELSLQVSDLTIEPPSGASNSGAFFIRWNSNNVSDDDDFDLLVLALGFGVEKTIPPVPLLSYWRGDMLDQSSLDSDSPATRRVLVSGCGDGGLTDYLRLRVSDFNQEELPQLVNDPRLAGIAQQLAQIEREAEKLELEGNDPTKYITRNYRDLKCPGLDEQLRGRLRPDTEVVLNGSGSGPLDRRSSVLNRFLASRLLWGAAPARYIAARVEAIAEARNGLYKVTFRSKTQSSEDFHTAVIRHGAKPALQDSFPDIWQLCEPLRARNELDQTRSPLWPPGWFPAVLQATASSPTSSSGSSVAFANKPSAGTDAQAELERAGADLNDLIFRKASAEEIMQARQRIRDARRILRSNPMLKPGRTLASGRYELLEVLGAGGFATVWKARDKEQDELVAVKILHEHIERDAARRERFRAAALTMARLVHPSIVHLRVVSAPEETPSYYVMDYYHEGDLRTAILKKRITPDNTQAILSIIGEIGGALDCAHLAEQPLLHRDVKPSNVLLRCTQGQWSAGLADFDLLHATNESADTRTAAVGSFFYTAPEIVDQTGRLQPSSDIFSLGMTALFAFYGRDLPMQALREPHAFINDLALPRLAKDALNEAVEVEPKRRPKRAIGFCQMLKDGFARKSEFASDSYQTLLFPESSALRRLLFAMFPHEEEFEAFIIDSFNDGQFMSKIDRQGRITGLLLNYSIEDIKQILLKCYPDRFHEHNHLLHQSASLPPPIDAEAAMKLDNLIFALLRNIFPTFSEFEAFCWDYHPKAALQFTSTMEKHQCIKILLDYCQDSGLLYSQIRAVWPDSVELYEHPIPVLIPTTETILLLTNKLLLNDDVLDLFCKTHYANLFPAIAALTQWEQKLCYLLRAADYSILQIRLRAEFPEQWYESVGLLVSAPNLSNSRLRNELLNKLKRISDFNRFCERYFRLAWLQFASGMDINTRISLLFLYANPAMILLRLNELSDIGPRSPE